MDILEMLGLLASRPKTVIGIARFTAFAVVLAIYTLNC